MGQPLMSGWRGREPGTERQQCVTGLLRPGQCRSDPAMSPLWLNHFSQRPFSPHSVHPPTPPLPRQGSRALKDTARYFFFLGGDLVAPGGRMAGQLICTWTVSSWPGRRQRDLTDSPHLGPRSASASCCSLRAGEKSPLNPARVWRVTPRPQ